jgi:hypothetical protein
MSLLAVGAFPHDTVMIQFKMRLQDAKQKLKNTSWVVCLRLLSSLHQTLGCILSLILQENGHIPKESMSVSLFLEKREFG